MKRQRTYVLTNTLLDESPGIAPNGALIMYAAKRNNQGVLAVVSVDGKVKSVLPSKADKTCVVSWSPYKQ